jgi:sugar phosphate isomerase/epimerase
VWERTVDRDDLIPPDLMLRTVQELGYRGIELGPPGYLGADADAVLRTLEA